MIWLVVILWIGRMISWGGWICCLLINSVIKFCCCCYCFNSATNNDVILKEITAQIGAGCLLTRCRTYCYCCCCYCCYCL